MLICLEAAGLKVKCQLFQTEVEYLGHVVCAAGVATDPNKVRAVHDWSRPRCVKEICSFLGFCSYYRNYIQGFAQVASPLKRPNDASLGEPSYRLLGPPGNGCLRAWLPLQTIA